MKHLWKTIRHMVFILIYLHQYVLLISKTSCMGTSSYCMLLSSSSLTPDSVLYKRFFSAPASLRPDLLYKYGQWFATPWEPRTCLSYLDIGSKQVNRAMNSGPLVFPLSGSVYNYQLLLYDMCHRKIYKIPHQAVHEIMHMLKRCWVQ